MKKTAASVMGLMMLIVVLFSALYAASEAEHSCTGNDCPVCACIQQCERNLQQLKSSAGGQVTASAPVCFLHLSVLISLCFLVQATPVSQKVRLNP